MAVVYSAGGALYTVKDGQRYWALVREKSGNIGLPKGRVEPREGLAQAALREIWEETGIRATLHRGVRPIVDSYRMADGSTKRVAYYLAYFRHQQVHADESQVDEAFLLPLDEALAALSHESARCVLRQADELAEGITLRVKAE